MSTFVAELQANFSQLDYKLSDLTSAMEARLKSPGSRLDVTDVRIEKLEHIMKDVSAHPVSNNKAMEDEVRQQITAVQSKRPAASANLEGDKQKLTAVIGNLDALHGLAEATSWLQDKLASLSSPDPCKIYEKGAWKEMIFAEFRKSVERDTAVGLLRTAGLQSGGKQI